MHSPYASPHARPPSAPGPTPTSTRPAAPSTRAGPSRPLWRARPGAARARRRPRPLAPRGSALAAALGLALAGCALPPEAGVSPVESGTPERPRLRYLDGQLSMNRSCAVLRGNRLNPGIPPMRVNGAPIGFC